MENKKTSMFWNIIKDMIQCKICMKELIKPIFCTAGHTICSFCAEGKISCAQCGASFTKLPNLVVQNLLLRSDNLEVYLRKSNDSEEKSSKSFSKSKKMYNNSLNMGHNKYRCWITNQCTFNADGATGIVEHFKKKHACQYEEIINRDFPYMKTWMMNYSIGKTIERAIKIKDIVFIINISINGIGELGTCILMYKSNAIADEYLCKIVIECNGKKVRYMNAKVISAKCRPSVILGFKHSGLQISRNRDMYNALRANRQFKYTVLVERRDQNISHRERFENLEKIKTLCNIEKDDFQIVNLNKDISSLNISEESLVDANGFEKLNDTSSVTSDKSENIHAEENIHDGIPDCILT